MEPLNGCTFCGNAALGSFQVIPSKLDPSEDEQRRVMLCQSCKEHLQEILEPLVSRASASVEGTPTPNGTEPSHPESNSKHGGSTAGKRTSTESAGSSTTLANERGTPSSEERSGGTAPSDTSAATTTATAETVPPKTTAESADSPAYRNVLRLLQNRDFPMDRDEAESLAAGAYQLDRREVQRLIDRAVTEGELRQDGDQLRRD